MIQYETLQYALKCKHTRLMKYDPTPYALRSKHNSVIQYDMPRYKFSLYQRNWCKKFPNHTRTTEVQAILTEGSMYYADDTSCILHDKCMHYFLKYETMKYTCLKS